MQRDVQDALCSYYTSTAGVSRCFFRHFPTAQYTACLAQHSFKAYQELSASLIDVSAPSLPQTGGYSKVPDYVFLIFLPFPYVLVETLSSWSAICFIFLFYSQTSSFILFQLTNMRNKALAVERNGTKKQTPAKCNRDREGITTFLSNHVLKQSVEMWKQTTALGVHKQLHRLLTRCSFCF